MGQIRNVREKDLGLCNWHDPWPERLLLHSFM